MVRPAQTARSERTREALRQAAVVRFLAQGVEELESALTHVLAEGAPPAPADVWVSVRTPEGEERRCWSCGFLRLSSPLAEEPVPLGVGWLFLDVTDARRTAQEASLLRFRTNQLHRAARAAAECESPAEAATAIGAAAVWIRGNAASNAITGNTAANQLFGGAGNDVINGGAGNDLLAGEIGNDTMTGGMGLDTLTGGMGNDVYVWDGQDIIIEAANGGYDAVRALGHMRMQANIEAAYVIGTEVPVPGGAHETLDALTPTPADRARATIAAHRTAFAAAGLDDVWPRVIALVVQPGVEFDHLNVFDYERSATAELAAFDAKIDRTTIYLPPEEDKGQPFVRSFAERVN